jgi:photosystem II stability/assembly factor-like uncharacterized protein
MIRKRGRMTGLGAALVAGGLLLGACGNKMSPALSQTPPSTTTTSTLPLRRTTTTTAATVADATGAASIGDAWQPASANLAGMPSECGNVSTLSARPDRDMVITSVAQRGLFAEVDGAATWSPLGQAPGSATITNRGIMIVYDPDHPNTFWEAGIYNGGGVYRTDDNGATFKQLGSINHTEGVGVDLTDPARRTLVATIHETAAVSRSTDGGQTWTDLSAALPPNAGHAGSPLVFNAQTYVVGSHRAPGSGVLRTTDGGASWTVAFKGGVVGVPLVAKSDGAIYWVLDTGGVIRSTDQGATWKQVARDGATLPGAGMIAELPDGRLAALGKAVVILSADHGTTWRAVGPGLPINPNGLAYSPYRKAFYAWYFTCHNPGDNPVLADSIMTLAFDTGA